MSPDIRSIAPLGRLNPIHPITPYAHYPHRDEQSIVSPYDYPQSSARQWARSVKKTAESIHRLLQEVRATRSAALSMAHASSSVWEERTAISSNSAAVSGTAERGSSKQRYDIMVSRLASSQINKGYTLLKTGHSVIGEGFHSFKLTTSVGTAELSVRIKAEDTNGNLLGQMANAINDAKLGVTALIQEDKKERTLQLEIISNLEGTASAFSIADSGSAISVAATGIGKIGQAAEDALYQIGNGDWTTADRNSATIDNGKATVFFHETTPNPVSLIVKTNDGAVANQVQRVLVKANRLAALLDSMSDLLHPSLKSGLFQAMNIPAAERAGIAKLPAGGWKLDHSVLEKAIEADEGQARLDLTGSAGWAMSLARTLERFEQMPAQAMMNPAAIGQGQFTLYQSSMQSYWQMPVSGWIMNSRW